MYCWPRRASGVTGVNRPTGPCNWPASSTGSAGRSSWTGPSGTGPTRCSSSPLRTTSPGRRTTRPGITTTWSTWRDRPSSPSPMSPVRPRPSWSHPASRRSSSRCSPTARWSAAPGLVPAAGAATPPGSWCSTSTAPSTASSATAGACTPAGGSSTARPSASRCCWASGPRPRPAPAYASPAPRSAASPSSSATSTWSGPSSRVRPGTRGAPGVDPAAGRDVRPRPADRHHHRAGHEPARLSTGERAVWLSGPPPIYRGRDAHADWRIGFLRPLAV